MLGLVQTLDDDSSDDDFVVGKINDFGDDLASMPSPAKRPAPRDLDLELGAPEADRLPPPAVSIPPTQRLPVGAKSGVRLAPPGNPNSMLDDLDEPRPATPAARPQPRPAARAAAPAAAPARQSGQSALSLQLEIEGLSGELRRALEGLLGKVIELPPLRIRVKTDDL
jgi:serine/threonine protein kinase